jgi:hypothetical protein
MIRIAFSVFGIGVVLVALGALVVLVVAARAPEGFEDEHGYHSGVDAPLHPSG